MCDDLFSCILFFDYLFMRSDIYLLLLIKFNSDTIIICYIFIEKCSLIYYNRDAIKNICSFLPHTVYTLFMDHWNKKEIYRSWELES